MGGAEVKTSRISLNQMFCLMFLFLIASATLSNVGRNSGQNVWIVLLVAAMIGCVLFAVYHRISYLHGYNSLGSILKDVFGKVIGSLVVIAYSGYFLYLAIRLFNSIGNMVEFTLMPSASRFLILGLMMLVVLYGLMVGINSIGRTSELLVYVVLISLIPLIGSVFTSDIFKLDNFFPILEKGWAGIYEEIFRVTMFPFGELIAFLVIFPLIPTKQNSKIKKYGYISLICGCFTLIVIDVINVGILGPDLTYNFVYPFYNSMKMVGMDVFFERLDPLAIIILITTCFFKFSIYFYAGVNCLSSLSKKIQYRYLLIPIGVLMVIICPFLSPNQVSNLEQVLTINTHYVSPIFQLAIPSVIWLISEIKYHKHPKEKSEVQS